MLKDDDSFWWWIVGVVFFVAAVAALIAVVIGNPRPAKAQQHDHDLYHAEYQDWGSEIQANCCGDNDCGIVDDDHLREEGDHLEVLVADPNGDQWCPVTEKHLIRQSNGPRLSPDPSHAHACILTGPNYTTYGPCKRFVCFMDKERD